MNKILPQEEIDRLLRGISCPDLPSGNNCATKEDIRLLEAKLEVKILSARNEILQWFVTLFCLQATLLVMLIFLLK
jgi:flagellar motor switch protein FliM